MYWEDEGYLISKNNFDENSIIIEVFTLNHGKYTGIVYGGSSRKQKGKIQIGNKFLLNWKSKGENKSGYFSIELIKPVAPYFFDDKKRSACILSATSLLKILLPERQTNNKIYNFFEDMLIKLKSDNWIDIYINWELSLIKELGYETNLKTNYNNGVKKALAFNRDLFMKNFFIPNNLKFPSFRHILENYFL
jgi:DNA repair protein RecO (recombination protein O)